MEREGESAISEQLNPERDDTRHPQAAGAREAANAAFIPKCITDKKYTLTAVVVFTILIITIISLAVKKPQPCPVCPPPIDAACPDGWVGYQGKCYCRSESEKNWSSSEKHCSSLDAYLAVIDTKRDLDFLVNFTRPLHYWIGLSKEAGQMWKWPNGTELKNQFSVRGEGDCAYIDDIGLSSTRCYVDNLFLCSQEDACVRRRKQSMSKRDSL
ncbi:C-type lectin domain family 2 member D-like isoform X3 [Sceloporus undulatus]|uniref:C-type lectin domain family 2 member D-like isoform X2 n=1 Tax=Sceloporus undulatus TaxID=8520 RepID=UPI001C4C25D7|nr:C-type lectin domain family 2 member D-like isoform X2 [Sceloporus undulatus]XP_042304691.1 C-type lectin domain family 2 member D-like isoform X2 [Sceloporus undulatus]XP_042304692.1 C-type lectin domain family 2 member D-like isoform X3 [Sceloporus undulatus]